MIGPPRGFVRKTRAEEITLGRPSHSNVPISTQTGYTSFVKHRQGKHFPGYGPKTQSKAKETKKPLPGPGDYGELYSSFKSVSQKKSKKSHSTFGSVPRKMEWAGASPAPGVGYYSPEKAERKDHPKGTVIRRSSSLPKQQVTPGPGDYDLKYSSFHRSNSSHGARNSLGQAVCSFGNASDDRGGWRKAPVGPGPASYSPVVIDRKDFRSDKAPQSLGGGPKDERPIAGKVASFGVVPRRSFTSAGPGDYSPLSDFDIIKRTFNRYAQMQAEEKMRASSPILDRTLNSSVHRTLRSSGGESPLSSPQRSYIDPHSNDIARRLLHEDRSKKS